jgi:hypothetical protein
LHPRAKPSQVVAMAASVDLRPKCFAVSRGAGAATRRNRERPVLAPLPEGQNGAHVSPHSRPMFAYAVFEKIESLPPPFVAFEKSPATGADLAAGPSMLDPAGITR